MAGSQTNTGINVGRDLHAHDISVVQNIENIIKHAEPPPKNIRFKVEKPIQTFTGRETFLKELHKAVKEGQDGGEGGVTVLTQEPLSVVAATGGIGKTETVRMYIKLHEHEYDHIIWIDAEDASFTKSQFAQLAMRLKIFTEFNGKPKEFDMILTEIFEKLLLNAHIVLLVFDNAEALEDDQELNLSGIRSLLPKSLSPFFVEPTIIVTSRNQNWSLQTVIHLDLWTEAEVVLFVIGRLRLEKNSENESLALQLGTLFGRLPIALQAAVAVILQQTKRKKNYGIQNLIDEYEIGCRKVLRQKPLDANMRPTQTSIPMLILWNISLEKIIRFKYGALAIKILCFMTYTSSTHISQDFLHSLFQTDSSQDSFENALEILEDYSLIASLSSDSSDSRSFSIHRMIQDSTIENLRMRTNEGQSPHIIFNKTTFVNENEVLHKLSAETLNYLKKFTTETLPRRGELVETLVNITSHVSEKLDEKVFRAITTCTAEVLRVTNYFQKSIELFERALKVIPTRNSIERAEKIELQRALAVAYYDGGHVQKSLDFNLEVLEVQTRELGSHHEDTLNTKSEVAATLHVLGRYDEALEMFLDVLEAYENNGDTQSARFLVTKSKFAYLLFSKGKNKEASQLYTEVVKEQKKQQDSKISLNILDTKLNIAIKLIHEGHLEEAANMMLQNIEDANKLLGPFHLRTLACRRAYASGLYDQGKYDLAASLLLDLLETEETQFGSEHRSTLKTKLILGAVYLATKELDKASALLDVEVMEKVFGPEDLQTLKVANMLSFVKEEQGKFGDALALRDQVLKVHKKVLVPNHKDTLASMRHIGVLYAKMDEYEKAAEVAEEVLWRQEKTIEKNHPDAYKTFQFFTMCRVMVDLRGKLFKTFLKRTLVDAETGKFLLRASNWDLEVALDTFANINLINIFLTWKNRTRN